MRFEAKLAAGEITSINDLITYNLDMRQFAQDAITYCEGTDLLRAFYDSIASVTVLDPTCGSGAFLFAALNILEMLYEACLDRMQIMIEERDQLDAALPANKRQQHPALDHFRKILHEVDKHPNRKYFIYKSIIINNLYGVDIMEEATEICKLRLFLKLVSQVDKFDDIEPLPDIDFNIRAGNTLVGFASYDETKKAIEGKTTGKGTRRDEVAFQNQMIFDDRLERIEQKAQEIERAFDHFRKLQTQLQLETIDMAENKHHLRQKLDVLRAELDSYLASEYGIDRNNITKTEVYDEKFTQWQKSHQPFHWWIEFYGIMKRGGFDVIIGNPPYVEYSKVRRNYTLIPYSYKTEQCGNLYAFVLERSILLLNYEGRQGLIVPMSLVCTQRMGQLQDIVLASSKSSWHSNYAERPSKLFVGAEVLLTISILNKRPANYGAHWSTGLRKWSAIERPVLFETTTYERMPGQMRSYILPKISSPLELSILSKILQSSKPLGNSFRENTPNKIFYRIGGGRYWKVFTTFQPHFVLNGKESVSSRENYLYFETLDERDMHCLCVEQHTFLLVFHFNN